MMKEEIDKFLKTLDDHRVSRRFFLKSLAAGSMSLASIWKLSDYLLNDQDFLIQQKAKSAVLLSMYGGPSQIDTFDFKPELIKHDGKMIEGFTSDTGQSGGTILKPLFSFKRYGQSGAWVSEIFPHLTEVVDDLAFIKSCTNKSSSHGPSLLSMNTGHTDPGYPFIGSWINYAIGSNNPNLPGSVVLTEKSGHPKSGSANWSNGFLPAKYQAVQTDFSNHTIMRNLRSPVESQKNKPMFDFLKEINTLHSKGLVDSYAVKERMDSFEAAFKMQMELRRVGDIDSESEQTKKMYGVGEQDPGGREFGKRLLVARRLIEAGVRFVQVWSGSLSDGTDGWDHHLNMLYHKKLAQSIDRPIAGFIKDLKQRGLLNETLVMWGGEFGRLPVWEKRENSTSGRDHNPDAFTVWFAGAGVKAGAELGVTDELGQYVGEKPVKYGDLHATILHLLGIDHTRLYHHHNGNRISLTTPSNRVVTEILS